MIPIQIRVTKKLVAKIDELIESGVYSNRSEVIRDATRRLLIEFSGKNIKPPQRNNSDLIKNGNGG